MPNLENGRWFGMWGDRSVNFKATFGGHDFTEEEAEKLFADEYIMFPAKSRKGSDYMAYGKLEDQTFINEDGKEIAFVGFKLDFEHMPETVPVTWCQHTFTDTERDALEAGNTVHCDDFISSKGSHFAADIKWDVDEESGRKRIMFA